MTDNALTTAQEQDHSPEEYHGRQEVAVIGMRIKAMLPGGDKLTDAQAMALAQYALMTDTNPFRGDVYGYTDSHGFHLVEGYKALVRWARNKCAYTESYKPIDSLPDGAIGQRCFILREDARATLKEFVELGATFEQAYELAAVSAVGVVTKKDMTTRAGGPSPPPSGWTWEQVAKKRALKNALNLSHGAPSPREIAKQSWEVNGIQTTPEDWKNVPDSFSKQEREYEAMWMARAREKRALEQQTGRTAGDALIELGFEPLDDPAPRPEDEPTGDLFLNGDHHGAPMDADAYEDLKDEEIEAAARELGIFPAPPPPPPEKRPLGLEDADLDYVPDGIDDWQLGKMWGKLYFEARKLGFANDHHVQGALAKVFKLDKWNEHETDENYRTAWNLLADYQRSKLEGVEGEGE